MSTIQYIPDRPRTLFTYYSLTPLAVFQLHEFSRGERDFADGEALPILRERKMCNDSGKFSIDHLEARSLVTAAYAEGWHVKYKV